MNDFFTKFKHLVIQLKQCKVEKDDDQLILAILSKLGLDYLVFVSILHTGKLIIPNWKMPPLNAFIDSLTNEHDKLVHMGIIRSSKYQSLFSSRPKDPKGKGNQKNQKAKFDAPNPKEKNQQQEESFGSKKHKNKGNQGKEKVKCSFCGKEFHPKHSFMKKNLNEMTSLLERNNINLPESVRKRDN